MMNLLKLPAYQLCRRMIIKHSYFAIVAKQIWTLANSSWTKASESGAPDCAKLAKNDAKRFDYSRKCATITCQTQDC